MTLADFLATWRGLTLENRLHRLAVLGLIGTNLLTAARRAHRGAGALLIIPESQSIEEVEIAGMGDIKAGVGFDTIDSEAVGTGGDRLFFDED